MMVYSQDTLWKWNWLRFTLNKEESMDSGSGSIISGLSQVCLLEVSGSDLVIWGLNRGVSVGKSLYVGSFQHYRRFETRCSIPEFRMLEFRILHRFAVPSIQGLEKLTLGFWVFRQKINFPQYQCFSVISMTTIYEIIICSAIMIHFIHLSLVI